MAALTLTWSLAADAVPTQGKVTFIGAAYQYTGKACGNLKSLVGWHWLTEVAATSVTRAKLLAELAKRHGAQSASPDVMPVTRPVAAILTYDKPIIGWPNCAPQRRLYVGQGADSAAAVGQALKWINMDAPGRAYQIEQIIR